MKTRSLERKSVSAAAIYIPRGSETPLKMEDRPTAVHNTPFCLTFVQIHRWSPRNIRSLFITLQTRYRSRHEQLSPFCDILLKLVRTLEKALSSSLSPCFFSGRISDRIETGRRATTWFARRGGGGGGALEKIHCGCRCGRLEGGVQNFAGGKGSRVIKGPSCVPGNRGQWNSSPSAGEDDRSLVA